MTGKEYRFLVMGDQVVGSCIVCLQMSSVTVFTRSNSLFMRKIKTHFEVKGIRLPLKNSVREAEAMFLKNHAMSWNDIPNKGGYLSKRKFEH